jgi:general secretion pathway protein G
VIGAFGKVRNFGVKPTDEQERPMLRDGFSLVEVIIVLVMIAIVAVIVIPQFSDASDEARESALAKDLRMVRQQIELFKLQHGGLLPGQDGENIVEQLTGRTDVNGNVKADGAFGPYMRIFPTNPFTGTDTVQSGTSLPGGGNCGWNYNTTTGKFSPDDTAHKDM